MFSKISNREQSALSKTMHQRRDEESDWGSIGGSFGEENVNLEQQDSFLITPYEPSWDEGLQSQDSEAPSDENEKGVPSIQPGGDGFAAVDTKLMNDNEMNSNAASNQEPMVDWGVYQKQEEVTSQGEEVMWRGSSLDPAQDMEIATNSDSSDASNTTNATNPFGCSTPVCTRGLWLLLGLLIVLVGSLTVTGLACVLGVCEKVPRDVTPATVLAPDGMAILDAPTNTTVTSINPVTSPSEHSTLGPSFDMPMTLHPTSTPTTGGYVDVPLSPDGAYIKLPSYSLVALTDPSSPQYKALHWIIDNYSSLVLKLMKDWRKQQLFVMVSIYYSFGGDDWHRDNKQDWLKATVHECDWIPKPIEAAKGPQIACRLGRITLLRFSFISATQGLKNGSMPPEVELLDALESLTIEESYLEGSLDKVIPPQVARLAPRLRKLDLRFNRLHGTIPSHIWGLTALTELTLSRNDLSGSLPNEVAHLTKLRVLRLDNNDSWSGTIPSELGLLTELVEVEFGHCGLKETIPAEVGLLTELTSLGLYWTSVSGPVPTQLGMLPLSKLYLHHNSLQGKIPRELGHLRSLTWLSLDGNSLSGPVPSELGLLSNSLLGLQMEFNSPTVVIPEELESLSELLVFDIGGSNMLSGDIDTKAVCKNAESLDQQEIDVYCSQPACWDGCGCLKC